MRAKKVVAIACDEKWVENLKVMKDEMETALGNNAVSIEHIGSTSVVRLAAKPIIGIDAVINTSCKFR